MSVVVNASMVRGSTGSILTRENGIYMKLAGRPAPEVLEDVGNKAAAFAAIGSYALWRGFPSADIQMEEMLIPVQGACELPGLDPFYVANEGRFVAFVPEADEDLTPEVLRSYSFAANAVRVGTACRSPSGVVTLDLLNLTCAEDM